jgi:hypothetical protein
MFVQKNEMQEISGIIVKGYGAAGADPNNRRNGLGTIAMQAPHFKAHGLDLDKYFGCQWKAATLNVNIAPYVISDVRPGFHLRSVKWDPNDTPEDFMIVGMVLRFRGKDYKAVLYYVDPATKQNCFQPRETMEIVAEMVDDIGYGDGVTLLIDPAKIFLNKAPALANQPENRPG